VQKINQKNTWELNLIDHLTDIIKAEEENDTETNFQKVCNVCFKLVFILISWFKMFIV
jgi:hypothetical protein